jgi:hypothetical protein
MKVWKCNRERQHTLPYEGDKCPPDGCILISEACPEPCINLPPEASEYASWEKVELFSGESVGLSLTVRVFSLTNIATRTGMKDLAGWLSNDLVFCNTDADESFKGTYTALIIRETPVSRNPDTPGEHQEEK